MTTPARFSLRPRLSRTQIVFSVVIGLLAIAGAFLALNVYFGILATNSAFQGGYIITDLTDIQRAILHLRNATNLVLDSSVRDFKELELRRGLVHSQLRLARTEAAGTTRVTDGLDQMQALLDEFADRVAVLEANPTPEQFEAARPVLVDLIDRLTSLSRDLDNQEESLFFNTVGSALHVQRVSQTILIVLSGLLLVFSTLLVLSLRRTVNTEFEHAYHLLEGEVAEHRQTAQELRSANQRLQAYNDRLRVELELARRIQQSLLPPPRPNWDGLDVVCHSTPAYEVGGDFYAYRARRNGNFTLAVGDVSGKGMSAALFMATSLSHFDSAFTRGLSPGELLAKLDQALVRYTKTTHQNCALCYIEIAGKTLHVANAGGIPPYIRRADGRVEELEIGGMPLGVGLGADSGYQAITVSLDPGDMIILTSDGVAEAMSPATKDIFGFERLKEAVASGPGSGAQAMIEHLEGTVANFIADSEPHDDLTVVVLQVKS